MSRLRAWLRPRPVRVFGALLAVWLLVFFTSKPGVTADAHNDGSYNPILARGDGHYMYLLTLSLVLDRDLDLGNQLKLAGDPFDTAGKPTPTGRRWIYPIGSAVLQIPFFLVAEGAAAVADQLGARIPLHGYTYFHQRITFLGAVLAGFFALIFGFRLARRHTSETAALYATAVVGLGTAVYFYSVFAVSYAHAWTAFACALYLDVWDATRGRTDARRWAVVGALLGLCVLSREQEAVFALPLVVEGVVALVRRRVALVRLAGCGALAVLCALAVASPQLIAKQLVFGSVLATGAGASYMRWDAPFFWATLYATKNGLFVWTPLAYLGAAGLLAGKRGGPRALGLVLLAVFLAATWVNGSAWSYWSDFSFSNRRFVDCTPLFVLGVAFVVERLRDLHARWPRLAPHAALVAVLAPLVVLNLELAGALADFKIPTQTNIRASDLYGGSLHRILERVEQIGGPFTWPYSWLWGLRNGVSPGRFDTSVGQEHLYLDGSVYRHRGALVREVLHIAGSDFGGYGAGVPGVTDGKLVWARDGSRLLVNLFLVEDVHFDVTARVAVPTTVSMNGAATRLEPGPETFFRLDGGLRIGTNTIAFACAAESQPGCVQIREIALVYQVHK